jgi:hypothetical protein
MRLLQTLAPNWPQNGASLSSWRRKDTALLEELVTAEEYYLQPGNPIRGPSEAELNELMHLGERFPSHRIFWHVDSARGVRYTAQGSTIGVRPYSIITDDLAELRDELEQTIRYALGRWGLRRPVQGCPDWWPNRRAQCQVYS